ncbi:MAG: energy-coupling factor ABC transporter ATP-binding protein [Thermodesulfobacteriota bacterium]
MISLSSVSFSYLPGKPLISYLSVQIERGSRVAILGPDGSGKTTLAKLIAGLLQPDSGSVVVSEDSRVPVGYVGGDPYDALVGVSVEEDIVFGLENAQVPADEIQALLDRALQWTGLTGLEKRLTHTLSGGEQQKLALAGFLAMGTRVLILDEALSMLDTNARRSIRSLLEDLRKDPGLTVIEIANDVEAILSADRVLFLARGAIVFDGSPSNFLVGERGSNWLRLTGGLGALLEALLARGTVTCPTAEDRELTRFLFNTIIKERAGD